MSSVSNFTIIATIRNHSAQGRLNYELASRGAPHEFERMDQNAGGNKVMEHVVFGLAVDYVPFETVRDAILSVDWPDPHGVVLAYLGQHDMTFAVYDMPALRASAAPSEA